MDAHFGEIVTLLGLLFAAIVSTFRAVEEVLKKKTLGVYATLAGASVALFAVYADKIVVK